MEDTQKKALDFAADVTKQLIALSTGIISLCAAFTDKIFSKTDAQNHSTLIAVSLGVFVLSILFGLLTQMKLTGLVANFRESKEPTKSVIYDVWTRIFSFCQLISFFVAVFLSLVFVWKSLGSSEPHKPIVPTGNVVKQDTLYIKIDCNCGREVQKKQKVKNQNSCIKYIRVNTCQDTIVPKANVLLNTDTIYSKEEIGHGM